MDAAVIQHILVLGAGTCGRQIAVQFARFGFSVVVQDVDQAAIDACPLHLDEFLGRLVREGVIFDENPERIRGRIDCTSDRADAASDADLLIESVTEDLEVKRGVLHGFGQLCPERTIFTTNSSYLLPSSLARASGRPDRFAAFHFHVPVWHANAVDVMPHPATAPEVVQTLCDLAWRIGQVPIRSRRENPGYVFNAILHPLLLYSLDLAARGVADFEDVDRAWMAITKMPVGPFGIVDQIGLDTVHRILETWGRWLPGKQARGATELLQGYLDQQRTGQKSGRGFYRYPHPAFSGDAFLRREAPAADNASDDASVTDRFIPHPVPSGPLATRPEDLHRGGGALVVGSGPLAARLVERLCTEGWAADSLPRMIPLEDVAGWVERAWLVAPRPHLFLVAEAEGAPPNTDQDAAWFTDFAARPFAAAQAWFRLLGELPDRRQATLASLTRIGGSFGFDGPVHVPWGGGLAGLVKSVAVESMVRMRPGIAARCIDLSPDVASDQAVDTCLAELAAAQSEMVTGDIAECLRRHVGIEVAYQGPQRLRIQHRRAGVHSPTPAATQPRGSWLVTGGSGGITLQVALALAREFSLRLHILGRTVLPDTDYLQWPQDQLESFRKDVMRSAYRHGQKPNAAWRPYARAIEVQRGLRTYREAGVPVTYHACDVADRPRLESIVRQLDERRETISGVLHGAGVERSTRLELKEWATAETILRPKTLGTRALIDVTRDQPLEWFVAFGSLSGRFGASGQADYALANELMAKLVTGLRNRRKPCRGLTIHWPAWEEIGMAACPENRYMLEKAEHRLMPVAEGLRHILREIRAGAPDPEVVIVSPEEMQEKLHAERDGHEPESATPAAEFSVS